MRVPAWVSLPLPLLLVYFSCCSVTVEYLLQPSFSSHVCDANAVHVPARNFSHSRFLRQDLIQPKISPAGRTIPPSLGSFILHPRISGVAEPPPCTRGSVSKTMCAALHPEASELGDAEGPSAHEGTRGPHLAVGGLPKVLFVIGPTGVGKSRLSLDICLALKERGIPAEIISADSMQVYKGCDIATAKATARERQQIPHHLLDVCDPQGAFTAADYLKSARQIIESLAKEGKLPVVVGGTQLYIELLLWESAVDLYGAEQNARGGSPPSPAPSECTLNRMSDEELMALLSQLDSKRAKQLHPNDRRRIIRSIEVTTQLGIPHSELMARHKSRSLRYDACILWLDLLDRGALERRLRSRLSQMCADGLLEEVQWLVRELKLNAGPPADHAAIESPRIASSGSEDEALGHEAADRMRGGVLQGIGYKEFFPLVLPGLGTAGGAGVSKSSDEAATLESCIDLVVLRSLQYARQQRKWIKNKFLIRRRNLPLYFIETTDAAVSAWQERICRPALEVVEGFLAGQVFSENHELAAARQLPDAVKLRADPGESGDEECCESNRWVVCPRCQGKFFGRLAFQQHQLASKRCRRRRQVAPGNSKGVDEGIG